MISIYLLAGLLCLLMFYYSSIVRIIRHRIHIYKHMWRLPGPMAIPILGTAWQFKWSIAGLTQQMNSWGQQYAAEGHSIIQLWLSFRPMVILIRPEAAKVVLESQELITKGPEYNILIPWLGTGLLISTGDKWKARRRMLTPSFHFKMLNGFLRTHDKESKIFVEVLEKYANSGEQFDIFPYFKRAALDIICETAMGHTVSAQTDPTHPYVTAVKRMNELAFLNQRMPWMWLRPIWYASTYGFEYDHNLKIVTDFTRKVINDKLQKEASPSEEKKAFLDHLIELSREGQISYEDIREEVDTFMFEGHDTTSASMGWTIWCLAHNKECQNKVIEEMDSIFGSSDRVCTNEDLTEMKYLDRCIKEALRLRPSVPNFTRKCEKDVLIGDTLVPHGCTILISPMMIHLHPDVSWLPGNLGGPGRIRLNYTFKQQGRDGTIGATILLEDIDLSLFSDQKMSSSWHCQKFAIMEEKTMLSWFFRRYTVSSTIPYEQNLPLPEIIVKPSEGFPVMIKKREF